MDSNAREETTALARRHTGKLRKRAARDAALRDWIPFAVVLSVAVAVFFLVPAYQALVSLIAPFVVLGLNRLQADRDRSMQADLSVRSARRVRFEGNEEQVVRDLALLAREARSGISSAFAGKGYFAPIYSSSIEPYVRRLGEVEHQLGEVTHGLAAAVKDELFDLGKRVVTMNLAMEAGREVDTDALGTAEAAADGLIAELARSTAPK